MSFFKQFYGSVTKSDYIALRQGFIIVKKLIPINIHQSYDLDFILIYIFGNDIINYQLLHFRRPCISSSIALATLNLISTST